jgi:hypothetical protein
VQWKAPPAAMATAAMLTPAAATAQAPATGRSVTAGLTLGSIVSVAGGGASPYYGPIIVPYGVGGTFGPGRYCGQIRASHLKHLANGKTRRVLGAKHRVCRIPPSVTSSVSVTFAAS